jgi:hypothetical protein
MLGRKKHGSERRDEIQGKAEAMNSCETKINEQQQVQRLM